MTSKRRFYKSTLTVDILSEHSLDGVGLEDMVSGADCDIQYELDTQEIDGKQMVAELIEHRDDSPLHREFFALTEDGEDVE